MKNKTDLRMQALKFMFAIPVALFVISCNSSQNTSFDVKNTIEKCGKQLELLNQSVKDFKNSGKTIDSKGKELIFPRSFEKSGEIRMVPSTDWCSGFYPGNLWFMYKFTNNEKWKNEAEKYTHLLESQKLNGTTHDMGFKMLCSYGNGFAFTGNPEYKEILLQSAKTLITRFRPITGCIRSWDHNKDKWQYPVIIDNMMNLELLFWASRISGNTEFAEIAVTHARTTMKNHYRSDFSCYHVIDYDTLTGNVLNKNTHQGLNHESSWARGQAWGLYGFSMVYRETGKVEFLKHAEHIAEYLLSNPKMPQDYIPYWDFDAPASPETPRDASAAAIISSALFELGNFIPEKKIKYHNAANLILKNLALNYLSKEGENKGFLIQHSTGSFPHNSEIDIPIIYGDYYFLEALQRKTANTEIM